MADAITIQPVCRKCQAVLTLEEMHYYDRGDGTATCNACELAWTNDMEAWRSGQAPDMPER